MLLKTFDECDDSTLKILMCLAKDDSDTPDGCSLLFVDGDQESMFADHEYPTDGVYTPLEQFLETLVTLRTYLNDIIDSDGETNLEWKNNKGDYLRYESPRDSVVYSTLTFGNDEDDDPVILVSTGKTSDAWMESLRDIHNVISENIKKLRTFIATLEPSTEQ